MSEGRARRWIVVGARTLVSVGLLLVLARLLDARDVVARLGRLDPFWVVLALAISALQVVTLAWRWKYTAARLGVFLPMRNALSEYYLGQFLNQVLPGGVTGDVSRAWRHATSEATPGPSVTAVVLERASGQAVMSAVGFGCLLVGFVDSHATKLGLVLAAGAIAFTLVGSMRRRDPDSFLGRTWSDVRRAVISREAFGFQLVTAMLLVGSFVAVYIVAARTIGVGTPVAQLALLVPPVLLTMLIPVTVAGWGLREGAAAAMWSSVGLTPEDGVAISVAYGLLVLVSTTPGAWVLIAVLRGGRDQKARQPLAKSDAQSAAARGPARRSGPD